MVPVFRIAFTAAFEIAVRSFAIGVLLGWSLPAGVHAADDYVLGPGDTVKISVFDYPDLTTEARISESGRITFPLIGSVAIAGMNPAEAEKLIARELSDQDFIRQPHVTLMVTQFASQQVTIIGLVNKPGKYPLEKASTTLSELLAMAGGVAPEGGDKAVLVRSSANGAKRNRIEIDLYGLFEGDVSKDMEVKAGDIIYVPRAEVFYVYGEVQRPGMFPLQRNMNVAQAISISGGLTPRVLTVGSK